MRTENKEGRGLSRGEETKTGGIFVMTEDKDSKNDEEKPEEPTIPKPKGQVYQKLCLCDYLRDLYEASEKEGENLVDEKKKLPMQAINPATHEESS